MSAVSNPHDQVRYPSGVFTQTHPRRLATLATLFGMRPAPVERCRVLELGCGTGGNLVAMAAALPESTFHGIDLAAQPIAEGQEWAARVGVSNLTLEQQDILDLEVEPGSFDYIIAHGVYSWVPPAVQEKVLAIFQRALTREGVAYLSYNTLPGGYLRKAQRDLMLYHTRALASPEQKLTQSRAVAAFIASGCPTSAGVYKEMMAGQQQRIGKLTDEYLFHDDLCDWNEALYFHDLVGRAERHGLRYLAETSFAEMQTQLLAPEVRATLGQIDDLVAHEQYIDFLSGRSFRRTLLVHEAVELDRRIDGNRARSFLATGNARPVSARPDLLGDQVERFESPTGVVVGLGSPLAKAAMQVLAESEPSALSFDELLSAARVRIDRSPRGASAGEEQELGELLLAMYGGDMVKLHAHRPPVVKRAGAVPRGGALARAQASLGAEVTSLWHSNVRLTDPILRRLFILCDGTRDRAALITALAEESLSTEALLDEQLGRLGALALLEC